MILDTFYEENTEIIFSYLPAWEMFFSMHVLANPEHHASRKNWALEKEKSFPELVARIKELGAITDCWNFIIDSHKWGEVRQMEIHEMLFLLRRENIYQWNEWMEYTGNVMSIGERNAVLEVMEQYYDLAFRKEEILLRAYIRRILREEKENCQKEGMWAWCGRVHPRLHVEPEAVLFLKNHEFRIRKNEIDRVFITASTFVVPHLWMYRNGNELEIVKGILVEREKNEIPKDLVWMFKALGEQNRLQIVKHLLNGICTTQALAREMGLSEAAVSKHLKILQKAGLVKKAKRGFYVEYKFEIERIDYIPYMFYETMLQKQ